MVMYELTVVILSKRKKKGEGLNDITLLYCTVSASTMRSGNQEERIRLSLKETVWDKIKMMSLSPSSSPSAKSHLLFICSPSIQFLSLLHSTVCVLIIIKKGEEEDERERENEVNYYHEMSNSSACRLHCCWPRSGWSGNFRSGGIRPPQRKTTRTAFRLLLPLLVLSMLLFAKNQNWMSRLDLCLFVRWINW